MRKKLLPPQQNWLTSYSHPRLANEYSLKDLKKLASARNIKNRSKMKKSELIQALNETQIWKIQQTNTSQIFYTHDNGGRPFLVKYEQDNVSVYKIDPDWLTYNEKILDIKKPVAVFIGGSNTNKKEYGNSILVQKNKSTYIFIGDIIYSFTLSPSTKIIDFQSPVGNSDIPYAFAIDNKGYTYLLSDGYVKFMNKEDPSDPYDNFYTNNPPSEPLKRKLLDVPSLIII